MDYDMYGMPIKLRRQSISKSQKDVIWAKQRGKCCFCHKQLCPSYTHYDHIKESHLGGKSTTKNLRAVCANCHSKRHKEDKAKKADKRRTRRTINPFAIKIPKFKF